MNVIRFDEVFGLVDSCFHLQLLIIELQEQLSLAKALCEEKACSDLLKGLVELQDVPEDIDPSGALCSWYHQMKKHVQNRSSQLHCSADEDCFVNVRISTVHGEGFVTCPNLVPKLSFGTKYKGYCLHISIEEKRSSSHPLSTPHYAITSDIHLQGLEVKGREYLERGQTAEDFILQVVWPIMEENICV
ncbi:uncharacterized protein LOC105439052 [Strongylocentrotus purpuratus]|uniref:Uncharacterized protein n=1 Tax=Strongylocentrotus purpuratus TaxID=7668 RepID=A0A7M7PRM7_STRPU|nr:uncharacterized protein LOC105439052 [Strongylocentrotus purpuratus]